MTSFFAQAALLLSFSISTLAMAQETKWETNKDHSEIHFKVPYLNVSEVSGRFTKFSGLVQFDEKIKTPQQISVKIETASIETGNKMRDGHLKGSDFLQSKQFPTITFISSSIKLIKDNHFSASGELTIKDVTKSAVIDFQLTDSVKDTWGYDNKFVKFKSVVSRKNYNINWNKTLDDQKYLVGDEVTFWGTFQIQPLRGKTPSSKHMIPDTQYIRSREELLRKKAKKF
jgi:polyisoprenoid-binding protein YceI